MGYTLSFEEPYFRLRLTPLYVDWKHSTLIYNACGSPSSETMAKTIEIEVDSGLLRLSFYFN